MVSSTLCSAEQSPRQTPGTLPAIVFLGLLLSQISLPSERLGQRAQGRTSPGLFIFRSAAKPWLFTWFMEPLKERDFSLQLVSIRLALHPTGFRGGVCGVRLSEPVWMSFSQAIPCPWSLRHVFSCQAGRASVSLASANC